MKTNPIYKSIDNLARRPLIKSVWLGLFALCFFILGYLDCIARMPPYNWVLRAIHVVHPYQPTDDQMWIGEAEIFKRRPVKSIAFIGDSMVALGDWPQLLQRSDVAGNGIMGETTGGLLRRIKEGELLPKTVIIWIGINDLQSHALLATTHNNMKAILSLLHGKKLFMISSVPTAFPYGSSYLRDLRTFERSICVQPTCTFIDISDVLAPKGILLDKFTKDKVHLNWMGYQVISNKIENYLVDG